MKKALLLIFLICSLLLTACTANGMYQIFGTYPRVEYQHSDYSFDSQNKYIEVFDGYVLDQDNPYEWAGTEDGYVLIIHFVKEQET